MAAHWFWLILVVAVVTAEVLTGTIYLLMIALGLGAGALAAWIGVDASLQIMAAAIVAGMGCLVVKRYKDGLPKAPVTQRDATVHQDVGNIITVDAWQGRHTTVTYRGAPWQADLDESLATEAALAGPCEVVAMHGNRLMLRPLSSVK